MTANVIPGVKRISVDWENNGEIFWTEIQRRAEGGDALAKILDDLDNQYDSAYLPTAEAEKLMAYAKTVPGFADGPAHARTAILDYLYDVSEDEQFRFEEYRGRRAGLAWVAAVVERGGKMEQLDYPAFLQMLTNANSPVWPTFATDTEDDAATDAAWIRWREIIKENQKKHKA